MVLAETCPVQWVTICVTFRPVLGEMWFVDCLHTYPHIEAPVPLRSLAFTVNHSRLANFAGSLSVCKIANIYRGGGVVI